MTTARVRHYLLVVNKEGFWLQEGYYDDLCRYIVLAVYKCTCLALHDLTLRYYDDLCRYIVLAVYKCTPLAYPCQCFGGNNYSGAYSAFLSVSAKSLHVMALHVNM